MHFVTATSGKVTGLAVETQHVHYATTSASASATTTIAHRNRTDPCPLEEARDDSRDDEEIENNSCNPLSRWVNVDLVLVWKYSLMDSVAIFD